MISIVSMSLLLLIFIPKIWIWYRDTYGYQNDSTDDSGNMNASSAMNAGGRRSSLTQRRRGSSVYGVGHPSGLQIERFAAQVS